MVSDPSRKGGDWIVVFAILLWWTASAVTQVNNKRSLQNGMPAVGLVFSQLLLGSLAWWALCLFNSAKERVLREPTIAVQIPQDYASKVEGDGLLQGTDDEATDPPRSARESQRRSPGEAETDRLPTVFSSNSSKIIVQHHMPVPLSTLLILAGVFNAVGHCTTMWATIFIPPALAHSIRSMESAFVAMLAASLGMHKVSVSEAACITAMFTGMALASLGSMTDVSSPQNIVCGILLALCSNLMLAARNVMSKACSVIQSGPVSYLFLCQFGAIALAIPALTCGADPELYFSRANVLASVCHIAYSSLSFFVLSRVDAVSHGILKFSSRALTVVTVAIFFHYDVSTQKFVGLALCLMGVFAYGRLKTSKAGISTEKSGFSLPTICTKRHTLVPMILISVLLLLFMGEMIESFIASQSAI